MMSIEIRRDCFFGFYICIEYRQKHHVSDISISSLLGFSIDEYKHFAVNKFNAQIEANGVYFNLKSDCYLFCNWINKNFDNLLLMKKLTSN